MTSGVHFHPLRTVAVTRLGYLFRGRIEHDPNGNIAVIQMRDIDYEALQVRGDPRRVTEKVQSEEYLLRDGDILFSGKGSINRAVVYKGIAGDTVAAPTLFVIRVADEGVLPEYLAWYINQRPAQEYFRAHWRGTNIPTVTKRALGELEIPLPSLERQRQIAAIDRLARRERELVGELQQRRGELLTALLLQQVTEHHL